MNSMRHRALGAAALASTCFCFLTLSAAQAPQGRQGGRGGPSDAVAGQSRINALVVSGGGYHDYPLQARVLVDAVSKAMPVDWTVAIQGGSGTKAGSRSSTARHGPRASTSSSTISASPIRPTRRSFAGSRDAHRGGPPAIVIHCAMHTYRAATVDTWREFLGVTTRRHTKSHNISVKVAARDHSIMKGFKEDWVTPVDELYVIDKFWPNSKALATAVSPEDQKEYPLAWVSDYGGTRVFGTTLGHGNDTWNDPVFQDLLVRAFKWAVNRE